MKYIFFVLIATISFSCSAQEKSSNTNEIVFLSVNVIPMDKEQVLKDQTVIVKDGKVTAIGDSKKIKYNKKAQVINANGKYLMPGLAEMHAHVPPVDNLDPMKEVLLLFVANGVTTIRGMLGHPRHIELRTKIQSGEILGPRFNTSGPSLNGNTVKTPAQAEEIVKSQKQAGYDFMKIHPGITRENYAAIVKVAKEVNMPFAGHVPFDVGIWRAIEAGQLTVDHMDGFVESLVPGIEEIGEQNQGLFSMFAGPKADITRIPKLMKALREKNIWVVPTQALAERWFAPVEAEKLRNEPEMVYMAPATVDAWTNTKKNLMKNPNYNAADINRFITLRRKLIYECNKNGVGLLLGSDAPQVFDVPGFSIHHELKYMVNSGLTPFEAIRTGTSNVGVFLNNPNLGVIKTGAVADLILLNGNPLEDINFTKNIEGVMLDGKWLSKAWIDETLKSLEKKPL